MKHSPKNRLIIPIMLLVVTTLACNLPFGIGLKRSGEDVAQAPVVATPADTATLIPTPTTKPTATNTPEPTPTATLVVPPTATPTAVSGANQASAVKGGEVASTQPATAPVAPQAAAPRQIQAGVENVIVNGDFEANWPDNIPVATGWTPFDNTKAHFGWYKDTWEKVVFDGKQAQMIEIINDANTGDRYAGIFQTVRVVRGAQYELTIHGLVRSDEGSEGVSGNGYILQYGIDYKGGNNWQTVTDWVSLPFPEHPREDPNATNVYHYGTYTIKITPPNNTLTLFIRAWKKWPDLNEGNFDIDGISLKGLGAAPPVVTATPACCVPCEPCTPAQPTATPTPTPLPTATPTPAPLPTCTPVPEIPQSGGVLESQGPSAAVFLISVIVVLTLSTGAIIGFLKRKRVN